MTKGAETGTGELAQPMGMQRVCARTRVAQLLLAELDELRFRVFFFWVAGAADQFEAELREDGVPCRVTNEGEEGVQGEGQRRVKSNFRGVQEQQALSTCIKPQSQQLTVSHALSLHRRKQAVLRDDLLISQAGE